MDSSGARKILLPHMLLITRTALRQILGLGEHPKRWDTRTAITVNLMRSMVNMEKSIISVSTFQKSSLIDLGVGPHMWICKVSAVAPADNNILDVIFRVIEGLSDETSPLGRCKEAKIAPVEGCEWSGYRAAKTTAKTQLAEKDNYAEMMKEVTKTSTLLYFHGGAFVMMGPSSHRTYTTKLARKIGGRCLSVRYRLAPQNPFPCALVDAFVCYLYLLYPTPDALHSSVEPREIVFSGDSAGGNLCLALLQTILELKRQKAKVIWGGIEREVPIPAGIACLSAWLDVTQSMPSWEDGRYDYLPVRKPGIATNWSTFRRDSIWPASPARNNLYADDKLLCHPLVSPIAAKSWAGAPPVLLVTGQECLLDENRYVAMKMSREGVTVVYDLYDSMPHCFAMILDGKHVARHCFDRWGDFITTAIDMPATLSTKATCMTPEGKVGYSLDLDVHPYLGEYTDETVLSRMHDLIQLSNQKQLEDEEISRQGEVCCDLCRELEGQM